MFSTDQPILSIGEDKLGRASFAKRLATSIMSFKTEETYAIALQGKWGCGKTSVLNMAIEAIEEANQAIDDKEKIIAIYFNPWNFTDTNQLINQFFATLSNSLKINDKDDNVQKLGGIIENYAFALEYTKYIPVVGKYLKLLPELGEKIGKTIKTKAEEKAHDIACQRKLVEQALRDLGRRILIVIDDIDRLTNEQIRLIFQLVNSVAGFPYTTYLLAFDQDIVANALGDVQSGDGMDYLEKIIQIPFNMPLLNRNKLDNILLEKLNEIIMLPDEIQFDDFRWEVVFRSCISPFIETLRDVYRFCNTLSFTYSDVREEVDFIDMAGICALQVFAPSIFEWIKGHKSSLVSGYGDSSHPLNDIDEAMKICQDIYPNNPEVMMHAIDSLFPNFVNISLFSNDISTSYELHQSMRIASESKFELYFSLSLEDIKISRAEIDKVIFKMDQQELEGYVAKCNFLPDLIYEIKCHLSRIPEDRIELIVTVLLAQKSVIQNSQGLKGELFSIYTLSDFLFRISDESIRFSIIEKLFLEADFSTFQYLMHFLHVIELTYGNIIETPKRYSRKIVTLEGLHQLEKIFINRLLFFIEQVSVLDWRNRGGR